MTRRYDSLVDFTKAVKMHASGHWGRILWALVPEIHAALDRPGRHVTCPFHGGASDFRVVKNVDAEGECHCTCGGWDGFGIIQKARGWQFPQVVEEVDAILGGRGNTIAQAAAASYRPRASEDHSKSDAEIQTKLQRYWSEGVRLEDPAAQMAVRYLAARGLADVAGIPDLKFHPELVYFNDASGKFEKHPAILAVARMANGHVSTLHRTWLTYNGETPVVLHRKQYTSPSTNPVMGGAIRLFDDASPVLNLAEGLETALSVRAMAPEFPVWSTLNKELLRGIQLPAHKRVITVFADRDRSYGGQQAAVELVDRLRAEGRKAMLLLPPYEIEEGKKGIDWNDVVRTLGASAAANHFVVQRWRRSATEAVAAVTTAGSRSAQK